MVKHEKCEPKCCMDSRAAEEQRLTPQIAAAQWQRWFQQECCTQDSCRQATPELQKHPSNAGQMPTATDSMLAGWHDKALEMQHKYYDTLCEQVRINELYEDFGYRPVVFIRFNPDGYKLDNINQRSWASSTMIPKMSGTSGSGRIHFGLGDLCMDEAGVENVIDIPPRSSRQDHQKNYNHGRYIRLQLSWKFSKLRIRQYRGKLAGRGWNERS